MGRSVTPTYRVEIESTPDCHMTAAIWRKEYGRPTEANIKVYVEKFNESLKPGGCNEHIGKAHPESRMLGATIVRQADGKVMASYRVPMFQVIA